MLSDDGPGEVVEAPARTGADIVDAVGASVVEGPEVHVHRIADEDEIASVLAVADPVGRAEQAHDAGVAELAVEVMDDARHPPLVRLAGPVDVEVAEAYDAGGAVAMSREPLVEEQFRPAVHIERAKIGGLLAEVAAAAIDRRRGGVDQRRLVLLAPREQRLRISEVRVEHVLPVPLRRVGAGALVEHGLDRAEIHPSRDCLTERAAVEIVGDLRAGEIRELPAVGQVIDDKDVVAAARVERLDQVRPDESGTAGDDEHGAIRCRDGSAKATATPTSARR